MNTNKELSNSDVWFNANLSSLLGGEVALVKAGKQKSIDRQSLAMWILKYCEPNPTPLEDGKGEKPDFDSLVNDLYPLNNDKHRRLRSAFKKGCEFIWTGYITSLQSEVERLRGDRQQNGRDTQRT